jgi:hypothetical protein
MQYMKAVFLFAASVVILSAQTTTWLDLVSPILTPAEKKIYLSLPPEGRSDFEDNFWTDKAITADEYFQAHPVCRLGLRIEQARFGSQYRSRARLSVAWAAYKNQP